MSLGSEWFVASDEREKERNANGVSPKEAEGALLMYHSSVYPIATEMAEWLYKNWTLRDFLQLAPKTRTLLVEILEKNEVLKR